MPLIVDAFSAMIAGDEWRGLSHMKFDEGVLVDGQNRCCAVIAAGRSIRVRIFYGRSLSEGNA